MSKLGNYVMGHWVEGDGEGSPLYNAVNGNIVATATTKGLDFEKILQYGRTEGGKVLRKMTFQERGVMLKKLALYLTKRKEQFYDISYKTGATRTDSWIDIEGGFGNLFANASLRRNFPNQPFHVDGETVDISRGGKLLRITSWYPKEVSLFISMLSIFQFGECSKNVLSIGWPVYLLL